LHIYKHIYILIFLFVILSRGLGGKGKDNSKFKDLLWLIWRHYIGYVNITFIWVIKYYYFITYLPMLDEENGQKSSVQCNNAKIKSFSNVVQ
jgi:hypothetical protein